MKYKSTVNSGSRVVPALGNGPWALGLRAGDDRVAGWAARRDTRARPAKGLGEARALGTPELPF